MDNGIKLAVVQCDPKVGVENREHNLKFSEATIRQAAKQGANLILFPELNVTGYVFQNRKEAIAHSEAVNGSSVELWSSLSRELNVYIIGSFVERDGELLYDSSVLIGPNGYIGKYRKTHLWNREKLYFSAGNTGFPVFDTEFGKIAMLICWDIWYPETFRIMAMQGAELICTLNNWVYTPGQLYDETGRCMPVYHTMAAAQANNVYIAAASRIGDERGAKFLGNSLIAGPNGWAVKQATAEEDTILIAEVDLGDSSRRHWSEYNDMLFDRRTDMYDVLLGYKEGRVKAR
ncbi:nitrilase family protein [Paenibacillus beijingensis]|uniref:Hydratase n=1 Tax=Paenibacillus beijingensis TaxID=1126833 RepID=A0A0D5NKI2_9BACL|nr:nitrilase family protein [Paenibacillus beijingensis]AJY75620.1 hydratase [Paenibacillus beijingensis]